MRITVVGAGKVGYSVAQYLAREDHDVVVIEQNEERRNIIQNSLDVMAIEGNGASPSLLAHPHVKGTEVFIAVTANDEINMVACRVAKDAGLGFTMARIRSDDYMGAGGSQGHTFLKNMGVDMAVNTDFVMAQEISRILQIPSALEVEDFAGGRIRLLEIRMTGDSPWIDKPLKDLALPANVLVVGILRLGQMIIPNGNDILRVYDNVFFIGAPESLEALSEKRLRTLSRVENVMIIGAGRTGRYLALALENKGMMVKVIDQQESRCKEVAKHLKRGKVFHGTGTDGELLSQERVGEADAVICLTRDDELNLLLALLAKDYGAKRTFVRVGQPEYIALMEKVGVDVVLSPRLTIAEVILRKIHQGKFTTLALLEGAKASALEIKVAMGSRVLGKKLKDVKLPRYCLVGGVLRQNTVIVPNGDTVLQWDDKVIIFALPDLINKIEKYF
ncbi:MAG: Trk system potassium transporter TrkA [Peptococcaceae bacterium]|nr:Trk system potassium transporter TrkA [Peptococcaceae bacterium]